MFICPLIPKTIGRSSAILVESSLFLSQTLRQILSLESNKMLWNHVIGRHIPRIKQKDPQRQCTYFSIEFAMQNCWVLLSIPGYW